MDTISPKKSHRTIKIAIIIAVLIAISPLFVSVPSVLDSLNVINPSSSAIVTLNVAEPQGDSYLKDHQISVLNGRGYIAPGGALADHFKVPTGAKNAHLIGEFKAKATALLGRDDIRITIMDKTEYDKWKNGQSTEFYYTSGILDSGEFDVSLSPGAYFLVIDNTMSSLSGKAVIAKADLTYSPYLQGQIS